MLRKVMAWLTGSGSSQSRHTRTGSARRQTRLDLECLEDRFLLTAGPLYFATQAPVAGVTSDNAVSAATTSTVNRLQDFGTATVSGLTAAGSQVYFTTSGTDNKGNADNALYVTDDTSKSPDLVKDFGGSYLGSFAAAGSKVYFTASTDAGNGTSDFKLYASDGSADGTQLLKDLGASTSVNYLQAVGGHAYVVTYTDNGNGTYDNKLYTSDGTSGGTRLARDFGDTQVYELTQVGKQLFFVTTDANNDTQLQVVSGSAAPTTVMDAGGADIDYSTPARGKLFFYTQTAAGNGQYDFAQYATDGTAAGTTLVKDFGANTFVNGSAAVGSQVYTNVTTYDNNNNSVNTALYVSTASSATLLKSFGGNIFVGGLTAAGGEVYFAVTTPTGANTYDNALYASDGTAAGTGQVKDFGSAYLSPVFLAGSADQFYFTVQTPLANNNYDNALYASDGTAAGTTQLVDFGRGNLGYTSALAGSQLYFYSTDTTGSDYQLFTTNGTPQGTTFLKDLGNARPTALVGLSPVSSGGGGGSRSGGGAPAPTPAPAPTSAELFMTEIDAYEVVYGLLTGDAGLYEYGLKGFEWLYGNVPGPIGQQLAQAFNTDVLDFYYYLAYGI